MKNGIANNENELIPVNIRCAAVKTAFSHGNAGSIAKTEDIPIVTAIGIPINSNIGNTTSNVNPVCNANSIKFPPLEYKPFIPLFYYYAMLDPFLFLFPDNSLTISDIFKILYITVVIPDKGNARYTYPIGICKDEDNCPIDNFDILYPPKTNINTANAIITNSKNILTLI